ncbi:hypothetical protein ES705_14609 [subsurface metagenome]
MPIRLVVLTGDALVADVKSPKTFFRDSKTAKKTGTMPTKAIVAGAETYEEGYHAGNPGGLSAIDADLAPANIKEDVNIFGKVGTLAAGVPALTPALFRANAATGTFSYHPENINNNDTGDDVYADAVDQYAEVDFGGSYLIYAWRQFGDVNNDGSGRWKIEYYDGSWHDWVTGAPTRPTGDWSDLSYPGLVTCSKIRLVCTTLDDANDKNWLTELEISAP